MKSMSTHMVGFERLLYFMQLRLKYGCKRLFSSNERCKPKLFFLYFIVGTISMFSDEVIYPISSGYSPLIDTFVISYKNNDVSSARKKRDLIAA